MSETTSITPAPMKFPATIERHEIAFGVLLIDASTKRPPYYIQDVRLGIGCKILGTITGTDDASERSGQYPHLSIAEANAMADEIIRRWNAHDALVARVAAEKQRIADEQAAAARAAAAPDKEKLAALAEQVKAITFPEMATESGQFAINRIKGEASRLLEAIRAEYKAIVKA